MTDLTQLISEAGRMLAEDRPSTSDDPLRAGQVLWNALVKLHGVSSDIVNAVWNTDADPYYKDENIPVFFTKLLETG